MIEPDRIELLQNIPILGGMKRETLSFLLDASSQVKLEQEVRATDADLDHFKQINDHNAHGAGDEVIRKLAERWQRILHESDIPARIGGEEFNVLLPETDRQNALKTAERLRHTIEQTPIDTQAGPIPMTLSIGISTHWSGFPSVEAMVQGGRSRVV